MHDIAVDENSTLSVRADIAPTLISRLWAAFNQILDWTGVLVISGTIVVVILQIYCRYVLNAALDWPEEVARWGFVWVVFVGVALVQRDRGHIAIEFLSDALFKGNLKIAHRVFVTAVIAATCFWMLYYGLEMVTSSTMISPAVELPLSALYAAVPTGAILTVVYLLLDDGGPLRREWSRSAILTSNVAGVILGIVLYALVAFALTDLWVKASPATILMVGCVVLIGLGVPIGFAMVFTTFISLSPQGELMLMTISQTLTSALDSFILLAVPFYIIAAAVMNIGGVTSRLVALASVVVGQVRGGLAYVNVITNALMAGVSGSAVADAAALSRMLVQPMEAQGFKRAYACALTGASSTMAHLIPPSIGLIIYGALASASTGALFIAGIIPGIMVAIALVGTTFLTARKMPVTEIREAAETWHRTRVLVRALPALALPVVIVGGVRVGIYTATEAGAIAAVYALFVGAFIFRELRWSELKQTVRAAMMDTITIVFLVAAASPFAWTLATEQVPQSIAAAIAQVAQSPVVLLLLINIFLLIVGCFMDMIAAMVILIPIFLPMIKAAGIDPIHFGVIVVLNLVMGGLTPPFGLIVFVSARVGNTPVSQVFRAVMPFFLALLIVLVLVTYFPIFSLVLLNSFAN